MSSCGRGGGARQEPWGQVRHAAIIGAVLGAVAGAGQHLKWCGLRCGTGAELVCVGTPIPPMPTARLWLPSAQQISTFVALNPFPLKYAQTAGGSP